MILNWKGLLRWKQGNQIYILSNQEAILKMALELDLLINILSEKDYWCRKIWKQNVM